MLGLEWAVRRLRSSLAEFDVGQGEDVDTVRLPANLERIVSEIRSTIQGGSR